MSNIFFRKKNNIKINDILSCLKQKKQKFNFKVNDIKELETASRNDVTFFHSIKYLEFIKKTHSKIIITNKKFSSLIPNKIKIIEVSNVLVSVAKVTALFYPKSINDNFSSNNAHNFGYSIII